MPSKTISLGTTVAELVGASSNRTMVIIHNAGVADEIVQTDYNKEAVTNSANVIYNREGLQFFGDEAKKRIWGISDTATTPVYVTEVY